MDVMMQALITWLIIAAALAYVTRRFWRRKRAGAGPGGDAPASGGCHCSGCGSGGTCPASRLDDAARKKS